jgi:hypothetical protein
LAPVFSAGPSAFTISGTPWPTKFPPRSPPAIQLKSNRFGFEPEITAKVARGNWRIYQVPISYAGRTYEEGKKITWKDGVQALWSIIRLRFTD